MDAPASSMMQITATATTSSQGLAGTTQLSTLQIILIVVGHSVLSACIAVTITLLIAIKVWRTPLQDLRWQRSTALIRQHMTASGRSLATTSSNPYLQPQDEENDVMAMRRISADNRHDAVTNPNGTLIRSDLSEATGRQQSTLNLVPRSDRHSYQDPELLQTQSSRVSITAPQVMKQPVQASLSLASPDKEFVHRWIQEDADELGMVVNVNYGTAPDEKQRRMLLSKTLLVDNTLPPGLTDTLDEEEARIQLPWQQSCDARRSPHAKDHCDTSATSVEDSSDNAYEEPLKAGMMTSLSTPGVVTVGSPLYDKLTEEMSSSKKAAPRAEPSEDVEEDEEVYEVMQPSPIGTMDTRGRRPQQTPYTMDESASGQDAEGPLYTKPEVLPQSSSLQMDASHVAAASEYHHLDVCKVRQEVYAHLADSKQL